MKPGMKHRHANTKVIRVQARELRIHPTAQRLLVPSRLRELARDLDLDAIGDLHAVEYVIDGVKGIWVVDGQHRLRTLMDEDLGDWMVDVVVHLDKQDDASASDLFLKLNNRLSIHPFDKFDQARKAGRAAAVGITDIAQHFELKIDRQSRDGQISCVGVLDRVYALDREGAALRLALETLIAAWGRTASAVEGPLVEGLALLYHTFNGTIERPALVKKLAKYPGGPSALIGDARGLRKTRHATVPRCVAEQITAAYNAGRRVGRLDPL